MVVAVVCVVHLEVVSGKGDGESIERLWNEKC